MVFVLPFSSFSFFISYIIEIEVFDLFNNDTNHNISFISLYCLEGFCILFSRFTVLLPVSKWLILESLRKTQKTQKHKNTKM